MRHSIHVEAQPGELVITGAGQVGTVKYLTIEQDTEGETILYHVQVPADNSTMTTDTVFTSRWDYATHAERMARKAWTAVGDEFDELRDAVTAAREAALDEEATE
ncbi:MAG: hypothetical protein ABII68_03650 [Pseudomonadota bacterium]